MSQPRRAPEPAHPQRSVWERIFRAGERIQREVLTQRRPTALASEGGELLSAFWDAGINLPNTPATGAKPVRLTAQLRKVVLLMSDGRTNAQIAKELGIAHNTVSSYVSDIHRRLGTRDRAHAVATALRGGIIR